MDFDGQYLAQLNEEDLGIKVFEIFEEQLDYTEDNETETQNGSEKENSDEEMETSRPESLAEDFDMTTYTEEEEFSDEEYATGDVTANHNQNNCNSDPIPIQCLCQNSSKETNHTAAQTITYTTSTETQTAILSTQKTYRMNDSKRAEKLEIQLRKSEDKYVRLQQLVNNKVEQIEKLHQQKQQLKSQVREMLQSLTALRGTEKSQQAIIGELRKEKADVLQLKYWTTRNPYECQGLKGFN